MRLGPKFLTHVTKGEHYIISTSDERYGNLSLRYYDYYKDGLLDGVSVNFYLSGKIKGYGVYDKGRLTGELYEWYENGMIKCYNNGKQLILFDEEGYMYRKAERK